MAPQVEQLGASPISYMLRIASDAWKRPRSCNAGVLLEAEAAPVASGGMLPPGAEVLPMPVYDRRAISSARRESWLCSVGSVSLSARMVGVSGRGAA